MKQSHHCGKSVVWRDLWTGSYREATPDGYTLGLAASTGYVQAVLKIKLPFSLKKDIEPIIQLTSQPYLLVVTPSLPINSVKGVIDLAKSKPGTLNYGSTGIGSEAHVGMKIFGSMTGIRMVRVPYKGAGPALTDLIGGQIQLLFPSAISGVPHVKSGKLKALAVTTDKRAKSLPDLPTVSESGVPEFELRGWCGLVAPIGLPPATILKIHRGVAEILSRPDIQAKFGALDAEVVSSSPPAEFRNTINRKSINWKNSARLRGSGLSSTNPSSPNAKTPPPKSMAAFFNAYEILTM